MTADPPSPGASPEELPWWRIPAQAAAGRLEVDPSVGLSGDDVARRLDQHGPNRLAEQPRRPSWLRFLDQFNNLLIFILIGAAVLSAAVGDLKDPIVIAVVLLINAVLGYVQESRSDNALAALEKMLEVVVRVRRDGAVAEIPSVEVVPGDIVLLEAGDRIPADGRFLVASSLSVDESTITGESVPVDKTAAVIEAGADPGVDAVVLSERSNCGYMNTTVSRGRAEMVVTSTGMHTEVGRLAGLLGETDDPPTPLQVQLDVLGRRLALIAGLAVVVVFGVGLSQGDEVGDAVLGAVALAVAAIPEGLPAVVTVTLALGVSRMARERAIVRRLASVETLGSTTAICSDKTGTLTLNQMTATRLVAGGRSYELTGLGYGDEGEIRVLAETDTGPGAPRARTDEGILRWTLTAAVLCNDAHVRRDEDGVAHLVGDPTEGALVVAARKAGLDPDAIRADAPRIDEVPFDSSVKYMATLHPMGGGTSLLVVKGAPDVLLTRCSTVRTADGTPLIEDRVRDRLRAANEELAGQGLRVLSVASKVLGGHGKSTAVGPVDGLDLGAEVHGLTFEALVGIVDPARPEAVLAVAECVAAGIGVRMITGDHPSTAATIAAGLGIPGSVVTGSELDDMTDEELADRIGDIGVCARVSPEHKVRVVRALQSRGEVVAMTGDGVNDAPSLKQAEIGVAMGVTGTEVTKEASDLVLTDDNFATIVTAVERGRAIYENIVTFVRFQLTTNVAAIAAILTARLAGFPAPFNPVQILFVNILADGPPAMSLGMDPPRPDVMDRPPRDRSERILSTGRLVPILVTAAIMAATVMVIILGWTDPSPTVDMIDDPGFTMAFTAFVFMQMANALVVRSGDLSVFNRFSLTNRTFWLAVGGVVVAQVLLVVVPFLQQVFGTTSLTAEQWLVCVAAVVPLLVISEIRTFVVHLRDGKLQERTT